MDMHPGIPAAVGLAFVLALPTLMNTTACVLGWLCPPIERSGALFFLRWQKGWF